MSKVKGQKSNFDFITGKDSYVVRVIWWVMAPIYGNIANITEHPTLRALPLFDTPAFERLVAEVRSEAERSDCIKMKFGAVIFRTENGDIIAKGHNHSEGQCPETPCLRDGVKSGTQLERCWAIHAEQAALMNALSKGIDIKGCSMMVYGLNPDNTIWNDGVFYCTFCSRLILNSDLEYVVFRVGVRWGAFTRLDVYEQSFEYLEEIEKKGKYIYHNRQ